MMSVHRESRRPWWEEMILAPAPGWVPGTMRRLARVASLGYAAGVRSHQWVYRKGFLQHRRLPRPTICVGNITAGGTGKTPLVCRLASDLVQMGVRPAILLRGYRRERTTHRVLLVRDARRILAPVADAGDEAIELARRLEGAVIGVGADRYSVGRYLLSRHPIDCFILDDGFQHHRLARDINLVTVDARDPWGGSALLPAGRLREPPQALIRADTVVLTHTASVGPDRLAILRHEVQNFMRPDGALLDSRHEPSMVLNARDGSSVPLGRLKGRRVVLATGIGSPKAFEETVRRLGASVTETLTFSDHRGEAAEVWEWALRRGGSDPWLLMTEKDAVRWGAPPAALAARAYVVRMSLEFDDAASWRSLLTAVRELSHAKI